MLVFETEKISLRKVALIAGLTICIIAISAGFSVGLVDNRLIVLDDATATMDNIKKFFSLFQLGIFSWLITLIGDVVISWALYVFLKQVDSSLSLLGAWIRLIYSTILGIAILNLIFISILLSNEYKLPLIQTYQLKYLLMLFIIGFHKMWSLGLIIFGFHLFIIGYLTLKSNFMPNILAILLLIASFSYVFIHIMHVFLPQYDNITRVIETMLSVPMTLGELGLGIWLMIKGGKAEK
ncbi:DUF4386 domain-containing protein [Clostridium sp. C8-1-8]|uniref:DUF4386 domain-containing protein n=1 Tax=Clostridium sp. C8-1-8 TaxID=2698831 RepID=UPI00136A0CC5|nr:DUF4386 domain-containing protein [Clostridium sp. C8-1-8]